MMIMTTKGLLDTRLLAVRGGAGWTEYRLNGELVRRDSSGKLKGMGLKGITHVAPRTHSFGFDFQHDGVVEG